MAGTLVAVRAAGGCTTATRQRESRGPSALRIRAGAGDRAHPDHRRPRGPRQRAWRTCSTPSPTWRRSGSPGPSSAGSTLVAETEPDVLLLDHRLPDGDGVEAIDGLRASHPEVQVVVLTASGGDNVLVQRHRERRRRVRLQDQRRGRRDLGRARRGGRGGRDLARDARAAAAAAAAGARPRAGTRSPRASARCSTWWPRA